MTSRYSSDSSLARLTESQLLIVNDRCNQFESAWKEDGPAIIEPFLSGAPAELRSTLLHELIAIDIEYRRARNMTVPAEQYRASHQELDANWLTEQLRNGNGDSDGLTVQNVQAEDFTPRTLGDYRLLEVLGEGGMGTVYKAEHVRMGRVVALKILKTDVRSNPRLMKRFDREVRATARMAHPNIVTAFDAREEGGVSCLITEYIDGSDLDRLVRQNGPLPVDDAIEITRQAASGLGYAHERGVIHRDVKPANLLLDSDGVLKILDLGLARANLEEEPGGDSSDITAPGMIMGTAAYMAPEQARGQTDLDHRADIYSLGCTLFFLITGRVPFRGQTHVDTILAHATQPVPTLRSSDDPSAISDQLDAVVRRMLAKDPDQRFDSMQQVSDALDQLQASSGGNQQQPKPQRISEDDTDRTLAAAGVKAIPDPAGSTEVLTDNEQKSASVSALPATGQKAFSWKVLAAGVAGIALLLTVTLIAGNWWTDDEDSPGNGTPDQAAARDATEFAIAFEGSNSYLTIPDFPATPDGALTLECWMKADTLRNSNFVNWMGPNQMVLYTAGDGRIGVAKLNGSESHLVTDSEARPINVWTHVAGTWDGETLRLFIDGKPANLQRVGYELGPTPPGFFVGGIPPANLAAGERDRWFVGSVRAVRATTAVRYDSEFEPETTFAVEADSAVVLNLTEGDGTEAEDEAVAGRKAILINAAWQHATE